MEFRSLTRRAERAASFEAPFDVAPRNRYRIGWQGWPKWIVAIAVASTAGCWCVGSAGAAGILPPGNPPSNIAPSSADYLASIDNGRGQEGVAPMNVSEASISTLPIPEQVFILTNEERIDRGLQPIGYMTAQLNTIAQQGADSGADPGFPDTLSGGASRTWGGSIWAGGMTNVFEADYLWMYEDGWGGLLGGTSNIDCNLLSSSGCWGHRDIMLHPYGACGNSAPTLSMGAAFSSTGYANGSIAAVFISTCGGPPSDVTLSWNQVLSTVLATPYAIGIAGLPNGQGYWEAQSDGAVHAFGQAIDYGSMAGHQLNSPLVDIASTPDGRGYWLVAADGGIFSFGDARFFGSTGSLRLNKPIVGMTSTPDGGGYWLVASDGGIFSFGDAPFRGSMGGRLLNRPIVGIAADVVTHGYWLVAADGGIFSFDAPFFGSTGAIHLNQPIIGMESLSNGQGYRFEAADGGVFCFGQAVFKGSMGGQSLLAPVVGMAADIVNQGYWMLAANGSIFNFGGAANYGSLAS
jgi:hypothetical protein